MGSFNEGKDIVLDWIRKNFDTTASILDVGACDGKWRTLLPEYPNMDAVEVFEPNYYECKAIYRDAFFANIADFEYEWYDLIIFGDVIEHMDVETAQKVLKYAWPRCKNMIVAVPWQFVQGPCYGNSYEIHIQDDLTMELFNYRYPGFQLLCDTGVNYCYFIKGEKNELEIH